MALDTHHHGTRGLHRTCATVDVRKAYRPLSETHYPDQNASDPEAVARTQAIKRPTMC